MVEVFKTNVQSHYDSIRLKEILVKAVPGMLISFDLQDCDKILRTEGIKISVALVIQIVKMEGFYCERLEE